MPTRAADTGPRGSNRVPVDWIGWGVGAAWLAAVGLGFSLREEQYLTPEEGPGYLLGIVGISAALSILLYSARKRLRWLRGRGSMMRWMQAHIAMGVLAPTAILFHCNFSLGATNSNVALFTLLTVAGSGIVGRFLYRQVHRGLHGRQVETSELWQEAQGRFGPVEHLRGSQRELVRELEDLASWTRTHLSDILLPVTLHRRVATARSMARLVLPGGGTSLDQVERWLDALARTARFALYERLFRSWHALHVPLFVLLVATVAAHVIAVHMY
jgi:hypothetical protein